MKDQKRNRDVGTSGHPTQFATHQHAEADDVALSLEEPQTRIFIRDDEPLHDDDIVLIHMGAGAADNTTAAVLRTYSDYVGLRDDAGMFCVSVFGEVNGVTREQIFATMKHKQFGDARYGDVRRLFEVLPTTISTPGVTSEVDALQAAHFDIVVPKPEGMDLGGGIDLSDLSETDYASVEYALQKTLDEQLLPLFLPRGPKYSDGEVNR